jgi:hypothetical protein
MPLNITIKSYREEREYEELRKSETEKWMRRKH